MFQPLYAANFRKCKLLSRPWNCTQRFKGKGWGSSHQSDITCKKYIFGVVHVVDNIATKKIRHMKAFIGNTCKTFHTQKFQNITEYFTSTCKSPKISRLS